MSGEVAAPEVAMNRLRWAALVFLVGGVCAAIAMLLKVVRGGVLLDMAVLGVPVYFGLRRLSPGWRTLALVLLWVEMIIGSWLLIEGLVDGPLRARMFGIQFRGTPAALVLAASLLLAFWQYRVLTAPRVRALFMRGRAG